MSMPMPGLPKRIRVVAYIDGYNLYHGMREEGWRRFLWLDLCAVARSLVLDSQDLILTKYFTTRISSPEGKRKRQSVYLEALETHCNTSLRMYWGHYQSDPRKCNSCGNIEQVSSEKKTDVNIAVEMMTDAFQDIFDSALVITADSDLVPAISAIRRLFPQKKVVVAFPPSRFSAELQSVAHAHFPIGRAKFSNSQLPEIVQKRDGQKIVELIRPEKWQEARTPFGATLKSALEI